MEIRGPISVSGGKKTDGGRLINEDDLLTFNVNYENIEYSFAILMDGATGLGKCYEIKPGFTSAEWYVEFMLTEMKRLLLENPTVSLTTIVNECILRSIAQINAYEDLNNIKLEEYQKPSAGLALLRNDGKITDVYLIGDTQTLIAYKNGSVLKADNPNQTALQKLDNSVIKRMVELSKENGCDVIDTRSNLEIEKMLQKNRNKKNTNCEGSYWVCGTTPKSAEHGVCVSFNNKEIEGIILATDGFDYSMLELNDEEIYKLIKEQGTEETAKLIRKKQDNDPMCNKFPRFKKSDDLTVVYLDYSNY